MQRALEKALSPVSEAEAFQQVMLERTGALMKEAERSGDADRLRDEGITEKAIIRLAQRIAGETDDLGQAWLELQNAMDIAVRVSQEGRVGSNHAEFVDEVLRRAAEKFRGGDAGGALAEVEAALVEADAQKQRLLASGVEYALLEGETAKAARLLVVSSDLEAGGAADFETLRKLQDHYYESGRDKGINQDLDLSIELARIVVERASGPDQSGNALQDLGIARYSRGERESGTARLEEAVAAYRAALEERTRERVPLKWAMTQMNLGNALKVLGERESGTARLEEAVAADDQQNVVDVKSSLRLIIAPAVCKQTLLRTVMPEDEDARQARK